MSIEFHESNGIYNHAVVCNGMLYISGQVCTDADDITTQAQGTLNKISALLEKYGSDVKHVVNAVVYLKDISHAQAFNAVWKKWVVPGCEPSRACVEGSMVRPEILCEVSAIAEVVK